MKLWLDDVRLPPDGWKWAKTADEAIAYLLTGLVVELSLDHDLGPEEAGTGYDVITWIEEMTYVSGFNPPATIKIHSANLVGRANMQRSIDAIRRATERGTH